jgi:hypothetical protein
MYLFFDSNTTATYQKMRKNISLSGCSIIKS